MSNKKQKKIAFEKKRKRKIKRNKLKAAGKNPDAYYRSGIYIGDATNA